ncbi:Klrc1 [Phodopus roborovskii]|uniref:Klrc1 protein n=1 Tax=Phodopus roborovskii TaxID=109678 RepID=A0AAV0AB29_PHORO|nr:Klrc1 [Phodopus roborovskii]
MSNERVTYAELNVAKNSRKQQKKPRGTRRSISVTDQDITYAEFSFQNAPQEHPPVCRDCCCEGLPCPPEKLIAGILGIIGVALLVAVVVIRTVAIPSHTCGHCPKEWISYSHNCYYISVEKKTWNDSLESCISKNSSLLYIESEEEQDFLNLFSLVPWTGVFRKSRDQLWIWKKDSTFKPKITELSHDEHNCVMLSSSGLLADNCTSLHTYLCKRKLTN